MEPARSRFMFFTFLLLLGFVGVEARLFYLQVRKNPKQVERAANTYFNEEEVLAARGSILMSNDFPLAESVPAVRIWADANWTARTEEGESPEQRDAIAAEIEDAVGHPIPNLRAQLDKPGYRPIAIEPLETGKRSKLLADGEKIAKLLDKKRDRKLPGITLERTWLRTYPQNELAANVVGYVDTEGRGKAGLELSFDSDLTGVDGSRRLLKDVYGTAIYDVGCSSLPATPGHDVHLTLDVVIQYYLEEALDKVVDAHRPKWVSGVVLDPQTGDVLAMACRPSYDPNHYQNYDLGAQLNRSTALSYTPGSTFKPFMMAAVMEWTNLSLRSEIDCSSVNIDGRSIRDAHTHGRLTPEEIMAESSNIGMCKLVMRLCPESITSHELQIKRFSRVHSLFTDLGFGSKLDIGVPAESNGRLAPAENWSRRYTLASMAFGHEIGVTPIQLASAFATFANGGIYTTPRLIESVTASDGTVLRKNVPKSRRIYTKATADKIRDMLVSVVDEGTGTKAAVEGYTVAGKTSTAQNESDPSKYTSSFAGFAPARDPRLLVSIVVDQPRRGGHYGGTVAAPAASDVLARSLAYLRVPCDREP